MLCLFLFHSVATCRISIVALVTRRFFGFRVGLVGVRLIVLQIRPGVISRRVLLLQKIAVLCVLGYICVIALVVMAVRIVFFVVVVIGIAAAATRIGGPGKHCCLRSWSALLSKVMGTKIHIIAIVVVKRSGSSHPWAPVAASGATAIVVVIRIVVSHEIFKGGAASASTSEAIVVIVGVVGSSYHVCVRETADAVAGRFAGPPEPIVRKRLGRIHLPALLALEALSVFATFGASGTIMNVLAVLLAQILKKAR